MGVCEPADVHRQGDAFATKLRYAGLKIIAILPFIGLPRGLNGKESTCTLRDGMGREVGGGVQDGGHMYIHGWFVSMYGESDYNIVK